MILKPNIFPSSAQLGSQFRVAYDVCISNGSVMERGECTWSSQAVNFDEVVRAAYQEWQVKYPKFFKMDALCKLATLGAHRLLCNVDIAALGQVAVILANSSSTFSSDVAHYNTIKNRAEYFPSPSIFAYTLPNIAIGEICIRYHFVGENAFFVMEQPDWNFLVEYADDLLQTTATDTVLLGWVDCKLPNYELAFYLISRNDVRFGDKR